MNRTLDGSQVLFNSQRAEIDGDLVDRIVQFIDGTKSQLDCAIYDLRAPEVLQALAKVVADGKRLRIVYDAGGLRTGGATADPKPGKTEAAIKQAGLDRYAVGLHPRGRHLMHDKFLVRDGTTVWTGSANFTEGGLVLQDNNCLILQSAPLADAYTVAFEDLINAPSTLPAPRTERSVQVGPATVTPYFEPEAGEGTDDLISRLLGQAHKVRMMAFLVSDPDILTALHRFKKRGADIAGVYDPGGMENATRATHLPADLFWFLKDRRFAAAHSHPFSKDRENDFMHNKVLIFDDHQVVTGSYNFSENAEANDENLLLLDSAELADAYTQYFDAVYSQAKSAMRT
jgi:phosphatidylserine/phosphatidylglycerophosphate/cardiolipin synthase-like enzyme